jgi:hypothetical protein
LEITRLFPEPSEPRRRAPLLLQRELVPVTTTVLFEEVVAAPTVPAVLFTRAPLEITRLFPEPLDPRRRAPLLLQRELVPVTTTVLFEEVVAAPTVPVVSFTRAPLEITRLFPEPLDPRRSAPLLLQRELLPSTTTVLLEEVVAAPTVPTVSFTRAPPEIVRVFPLPEYPTLRVPLLFQRELVPVTVTELFEEVPALPMVPLPFTTLALPEITRLFPEPSEPTRRLPLLLQRELLPSTTTVLFEEVVAAPTVPAVSFTRAPLEIVRVFPLPEYPTLRVPLLFQRELVPVTTTVLFEEVLALPMVPLPFTTLALPEITKLFPEPSEPTRRLPLLLQRELLPSTTTVLFEEVLAYPIYPIASETFPPLEITRLLLLPDEPTVMLLLIWRRVPGPSTASILLEAAAV